MQPYQKEMAYSSKLKRGNKIYFVGIDDDRLYSIHNVGDIGVIDDIRIEKGEKKIFVTWGDDKIPIPLESYEVIDNYDRTYFYDPFECIDKPKTKLKCFCEMCGNDVDIEMISIDTITRNLEEHTDTFLIQEFEKQYKEIYKIYGGKRGIRALSVLPICPCCGEYIEE